MAVPANTTQTFDIRQREDLHKVIEMVTPFETPFFSSIGTGETAEATKIEWPHESLRNPNADNAAVEGDDVTPRPQAKPQVVQSFTQIFDEAYSISDTAQAVKTIQTEKELTRQRVNAGKAVKLDIEARMCGNYASVAGAAGTARKLAGALAWLKTAADRGVGGANGGYTLPLVAAATNGTLRPFTEAQLKNAIRLSWNATGGALNKVLVDGLLKQKFSGFVGVAQNTNEVKGNDKVTIVGSADVYVSDFGRHEVRASRSMSGRDALIYTPEKWKKRYLQPFGSKSLATTGHSTKEMLKVELTLACHNEAANAVVADIQ